MAKLTEAYLKKMIKQVMKENEGAATLGLEESTLTNKIYKYLDSMGLKGGEVDFYDLVDKFDTTPEELIKIISDQEFSYWTEVKVVVYQGGSDNQ